MKKIILITYYYPPMQAPGAYRVASFVKYLPIHGYESMVITPTLSGIAYSGPKDGEAEIKGRVFRVPSAHMGALAKAVLKGRVSGYERTREAFRSQKAPLLKRLLGFVYDEILTYPDPEWPWFFMGLGHASSIVRRNMPSVLLSSALPFTSHMIASYISSKYHIPWIADYRDLWAKNHRRKRSERLRVLDTRFERRILRGCSAITTVSEPLAEQLRAFLDIPVHVVMNGFDDEGYAQKALELPMAWKGVKRNIVYTGMVYPGKQDASPLFQALELLRQEGLMEQKDLKVHFYGPNVDALRGLPSLGPVSSFVELHGMVSHGQAVANQKMADMLLFLEWTDRSARGIYTTKFFEYLGAGKPILAIGPSGGVVDQALRDTGAGVMEKNPARLAARLRSFLKTGVLAGAGFSGKSNLSNLRRYSREHQTGILAGILEKAIGPASERSRR